MELRLAPPFLASSYHMLQLPSHVTLGKLHHKYNVYWHLAYRRYCSSAHVMISFKLWNSPVRLVGLSSFYRWEPVTPQITRSPSWRETVMGIITDFLTKVLMLQFWSFKRSPWCFIGSKSDQHGWSRDFSGLLHICISMPVDSSLLSLWYPFMVGLHHSSCFGFFSYLCGHLIKVIASFPWDSILRLIYGVFLIAIDQVSRPAIGMGARSKPPNWDWMETNTLGRSRSLCIPNVSFLEHRVQNK